VTSFHPIYRIYYSKYILNGLELNLATFYNDDIINEIYKYLK